MTQADFSISRICKITFKGLYFVGNPLKVIKMPTTRAAARPDRQQHLENAALRNRVKKSYEKAQQEEALNELLQLIGANGGKAPYGAVDNLVKKFHTNGFKAVTRQFYIIGLRR